MFDVVTVGNGIIDAFLTLHDANHHCRVDEKTHELCVTYGQKIPVDHCEFTLGGNACNVAVGLQRLGLTTAVVAEIGEDEFSGKITNTLQAEGVNSEHILQKGQSSFAIGIQFKGERTMFVEHQKREHEFSFSNIQTKWVYLTSLGHDWKNAYKRVGEYVKEHAIRLAFNPGTVQIQDGLDGIAESLRLTEILFLNTDEARLLLSQDTSVDEKTFMEKLHALGPKIVVLTNGAKGSFLRDENGQVFTREIIHTPVIEKTGAGDAYASGFLAAYVQGVSLEEAMTWGTKNAAAVISVIGSQNGLLKKAAMESV